MQLNCSDEDAKIEDRQGPEDEDGTMDSQEVPSREDDELRGDPPVQQDHPEARRPRGVRDPGAPTPGERAEHELHHANYREWCRACVRGRGIAAPHRKQHQNLDDPDGVPSVHFDYCFMGEKDQEEQEDEAKENTWKESDEIMKILTVKLKTFRRIRAHLVPKKGMSGQPWIAKTVADDIKIWGCSSVILKSDQERSLRAIHHEVQKLRAPFMTIPEHSPKGESQSNGVIERGNRTITEQVRVMIIDLEEKLGLKISAKHPIMSWLVEHAAFVVSYIQTGAHGKTPYERHKGKKANFSLCAFGEQIHYMPLKGKDRPGKRETPGTWMGSGWASARSTAKYLLEPRKECKEQGPFFDAQTGGRRKRCKQSEDYHGSTSHQMRVPKEEYQTYNLKIMHQSPNLHKKTLKYPNLFLDGYVFPDET